MIQETNDTNESVGLKTLKLVEDLRLEIAKLLPRNQLWGGMLSYDKLSEYLGMNKRYLRSLKNRVTNDKYPTYNPEFTFFNDQLSDFIRNLSIKFGKDKIQHCIEFIKVYKREVETLEYRSQQWQPGYQKASGRSRTRHQYHPRLYLPIPGRR